MKFKKFFLIMSILFLTLALLPNLINYIFPIKDYLAYSGMTYGNLDTISYFEKINNGLFFNDLQFLVRSNHKNIEGGYIFMLYSLFGFLFKWSNFSTAMIYLIMKMCCAIIFLFALYFFIKEFIKDNSKKITTFLLLFSLDLGAFGYLFRIILNSHCVGVYLISQDILPMTSVLSAPHFIYELALMLLSCICVNRFHKNKWKYSILNGLILLGISTIHPQVAVFYGLLEGVYLLTEIKSRSYKIKDLLPVSLWGIIPLPYLIYCIYIFRNLPALTSWLNNNFFPYNDQMMLFVVIPQFCIFCYTLFFKKDFVKENKFFIVWMFCLLSTTLLPGRFQSKLTVGMGIPFIVAFSFIITNTKKTNIIKIMSYVLPIILLFPHVMPKINTVYFDTFAYTPKYYNQLYEDVNALPFPSNIYSNTYTASFLLANTKQIIIPSNKQESENYDYYEQLHLKATETKDFSFLKDIENEMDYYVYDKYISKNYDTVEIETNLPYEKVVETENYIIYNLKTAK